MTTRETLTPNQLIELHVRQHMSLTKIGELYGITRQRVHQLKKEYEQTHGAITRRYFIDALTLKRHVEEGWTIQQIARHYQMKPSQISRLIKHYQTAYTMNETPIFIQRRKKGERISKSTLYTLYVEQLYTEAEIARQFNVSISTINALRKAYHIPTNNDKALRKLPLRLPKETFLYHYNEQHWSLQTIADTYQVNLMAILRLKERYKL